MLFMAEQVAFPDFIASWCKYGANAMETMDTVDVMDKILFGCEAVWTQWTYVDTIDTLGINR